MTDLKSQIQKISDLEQEVEQSQTNSEDAFVDYLIEHFDRTEKFYKMVCDRVRQATKAQADKFAKDLQNSFDDSWSVSPSPADLSESRIKLLGGLYQLIQEESEFTPLPIDQIERSAKGERGAEVDYSNYLAATLPGQREVPTPTGFIDVLTSEQIIEVKYFQYWKHAIGQVQMYGLYYPLHEKRVHLYGALDEQKLGQITKWSKQVGVTITWEP